MSANSPVAGGSGRIVLITLAVWLCLAIAFGLAGWFEGASAPGIAATVWGLTIGALLLCAAVPIFRKWATTVDLRWLVALHLTRFIGFYFLYLTRRDELPSAFAVPA